MTDTPPTDAAKDTPEQALPKLPTNRLPTLDELRARGWNVPEGSGKGYVLPVREDPPVREDHLVALLRAAGQPVTWQNWIDLNYGRDVPSPWTALEECELPEELQDWSQVEMED